MKQKPKRYGGRLGTVGDAVYRPKNGESNDEEAMVIDLAEARKRLASLRGEQTALTRWEPLPAGGSVPAHRKKTPALPVFRHPLIEAVLPDKVADALPRDGSSRTVGQLTHTALAILSPTAHQLHPDSLVEATLVLCRAICPPGRQHRRTSTLVAGFTVEYLRGPIRPRPPWQFESSEHRTATGRIDLVWRNSVTGAVVFDEVKTTEVTRRKADNKWVEQCVRYTESGLEEFGDAFLGVRLLPLGSMNVAAFITPTGDVLPLTPTWADPLAGTGMESS